MADRARSSAASTTSEAATLRELLNEVRCQVGREGDLPDHLLARIDAALAEYPSLPPACREATPVPVWPSRPGGEL